MVTNLIGLGGYLRSGKDALADYLVANHNFVKMGMSDPLNLALLELNPYVPVGVTTRSIPPLGQFIRYRELHDKVGYTKAKENLEVRRLLQALGTDVGRNMIHKDVWVRIASKTIKEHNKNGNPVVITAMRFPNELKFVKDNKGTTIWIDRLEKDRQTNEAIQTHASENSVTSSQFDYHIFNDGSLTDLETMAYHIVNASPKAFEGLIRHTKDVSLTSK